jgi:hypothetical protein
MRVQRDQFAFILPRNLHQPRIVHLLMTQRAEINRWRISGGRNPKMMRLVPSPSLQQGSGILRRHSVSRIGWIGGKPDKTELCESAGGPAPFRMSLKPFMRPGMVLVIWPGECQQNIRVEQWDFHVASSSIKSFARLLGITAASPGTLKTGRPFLLAVSAEARNPRRASCEITSPNRLPEARACCCAASKTSSSTVMVVLIRGYADTGM